MTSIDSPFVHQSTGASGAGHWRLEPGRALTLAPRVPGRFRLAQGRAWVTFDGPHPGPLNDRGDRVLSAGDALDLAAGQRLVVEAWSRGAPVSFSWDVRMAPGAVPAPTVREALADLHQAAVLGAGALGRLGAGVLTLVLHRAVRPRGGLGPAGGGR